MQNQILKGPRLRLRKLRVTDADASYHWFADPGVTQYLPLAGERVLPMPEIRAFLEQVSRDDFLEVAVGIELNDGRLIGCGGLRNIVASESAEISIVIGERDCWGQGYASEAMSLLLHHGFRELRLNRIWLIVRTDNNRALRAFKNLGFRIVDTLKQVITVAGIPRDKYRMELGIEEWNARSEER